MSISTERIVDTRVGRRAIRVFGVSQTRRYRSQYRELFSDCFEIHVMPVALQVIGADGRVDIEAFPMLNRVKLVLRGDDWVIYTDSSMPASLRDILLKLCNF